jgi:UDP-3-O-[3-hydroxymyristoyl] N-acetylglucosamine deacetylase/3-hydroxyacyl-[acyl-carrier-protein] dehydratase
MKQRTLLREVSVKGNALHTGDAVRMTLKPAPANTGIVFRRTDIHGHPEVKPSVDHIVDLVHHHRKRPGQVHTVSMSCPPSAAAASTPDH